MDTPHDCETVEEIKEALQNNNQALAIKKIQEYLERQSNTPLNIAITGEAGSGKSTFVNSFRGIDNRAEGAAPTGCVETTSVVTPYPHPNYPNVTLWNLPGVGTTKFPADQYLKLVGFEKFDFFIIISATRFTEYDVKLAQEIQKMKKKFYFVRSKIDSDLDNEKRSQRDFSETRTKELIKENCIQCLQEQGIQSPQVFLVSSFQLHQHDFTLLMETLERELPEHKRNVLLFAMPNISQEIINKKKEAFQFSRITIDTPHDCETVEEIKEALQSNNQALAIEKIQEKLDKENNTPLNIAITGESGSGKSSFINAFRGIDNRAEGAAPTGCVETTSVVTPYPHPKYPSVTLWDLPGIGSPNFPADQYLKLVGFEKFDFFIIISDTRFRENDVKLAQEIQKMKKKFYFVRSKIDSDLDNEKRSQRDFSETRTKELIKENSIQGLQKRGIQSPQVFLVSSFKLHQHDFSLLMETLERELPEHKRNVLLFAMPNISQEIINKKKRAFHAQIKWYATASAAVAAVRASRLSIVADVTMLIRALTQYIFSFGLDRPSLKSLTEITGVPFDDLMAVITSPLAAYKITTELILKVLTQFKSTASLMTGGEWSRLIQSLGIPADMALSFKITFMILNVLLNNLANDSQRLFERALGSNTTE